MKPAPYSSLARQRAFSLIELLTVIAIISILMGIVVPGMANVQRKAKIAKTKSQFNQWSSAMELFNSEYGQYPSVDGPYASTNAQVNLINASKFAVALTGRQIDGTPIASNAKPEIRAGNTKLINFYTISQDELDAYSVPNRIKDAFNNTEIAVLVDKDNNGLINALDVGQLPSVHAFGGGDFRPDPKQDIDMTLGIHASVLFYSAGSGNSANAKIDVLDAVLSWK